MKRGVKQGGPGKLRVVRSVKRLFDCCSVDALRKEVRKKRRYEAIHGKEWVPVTAADRMPYRDEDFEMSDGRSFNKDGRGRGGRGARGESLV